MYILLSVIILIVALVLILVVLVQNSKGGGLASNFASSNQIMGVKKTSDFIEKATWILVIALLGLSLMSVVLISRNPVEKSDGSELRDQMQKEGVKPVQGFNPQQTPVQPNQPK